uniref:Uncharacterized protein n=1 Tax=Physcomitrium patens TaxID=3218 RepID=A0A2K1J2W2_PHYPA|nr:hypothetical protein PHYPA_021717 [Physcomitrium patens]
MICFTGTVFEYRLLRYIKKGYMVPSLNGVNISSSTMLRSLTSANRA